MNLIGLLFVGFAQAAPMPATSSSVLTDPAKGLFFQGFGFHLTSPGLDWVAVPSQGETVFETLRFEPRPGKLTSDASLSIRMDKLSESAPLQNYARKWMRDYPSYGFEVLGTKDLTMGGGPALLVDLMQKSKNRQLRQVIMQKDRQVAVITCLDRRDHFAETLPACNQIIKSFEWLPDAVRPGLRAAASGAGADSGAPGAAASAGSTPARGTNPSVKR